MRTKYPEALMNVLGVIAILSVALMLCADMIQVQNVLAGTDPASAKVQEVWFHAKCVMMVGVPVLVIIIKRLVQMAIEHRPIPKAGHDE